MVKEKSGSVREMATDGSHVVRVDEHRGGERDGGGVWGDDELEDQEEKVSSEPA